MACRFFSNAAKERTAQAGSTMSGNDNQIGALLFSDFVYRGGAVPGNGKRVDFDIVEIDLLQKSLHPTVTPASCCLQIGR